MSRWVKNVILGVSADVGFSPDSDSNSELPGGRGKSIDEGAELVAEINPNNVNVQCGQIVSEQALEPVDCCSRD